MASLIAPLFNLVVLIGVMVYCLRQPLRGFVQQRHELIRDELHTVRDQLRKAQDRYDEFSSKLKAIDAEITALREQARQDASATKVRLVNEAQRLSATIISDARAGAEDLYSELRNQLYGECGHKILARAEVLLRERLTGDDQARIRKEFSLQVESIR